VSRCCRSCRSCRSHRGENVLGGETLDVVEPVVEHDGPVLVVGQRFVWVLDDQRSVQTVVKLETDVGWYQ
jgi:hypothetical protein